MWKHKKYKEHVFKGQYRRDDGERHFVLRNVVRPKNKEVVFESHEAAKKAGWVKL